MSPFSVANKSYSVNDRLAYESQLIHAVVEARAPLKQRLRKKYAGEGEKRRCTVIGHFKGEVEPIEYESPEFGRITPKNSPLWKSDPDQQLWYYSVRAWARANCPDVLLGIYSADELQDNPHIIAEHARDVTPANGIKDRLSGSKDKPKGRGFSESGVSAAIDGKPAASDAPKEEANGSDQLDLAADVENEMGSKRRAVEVAGTLDDLKAIVGATTEYLKDAKRTDLLADFLSAASAREKKIAAEGAKP